MLELFGFFHYGCSYIRAFEFCLKNSNSFMPDSQGCLLGTKWWNYWIDGNSSSYEVFRV